MKFATLLILLGLAHHIQGQSYTSYFTGDTTDVVVSPVKGTVLMGGASENDNAMRWFLNRANGGDILVLRTSGEDGYNDYFYSDLGVVVNSVETIVCNSPDASTDPYVLRRVAEADALWFAGGDQWDYVSYWRDTPMEDAFNELINVKQITIGGTSAGCAIQGQVYFSAENGTIVSTTALNNPFHNLIQLGYNDFLNNPATQQIITDSHYDNPDRRGRQMVFLARLVTEYGIPFYGIGVEEYTSVCIDENNIAHVYGEYPAYQEYAYFLQANCFEPSGPEVCVDGEKLTWNRDNAALKVIKLAGKNDGSVSLDLNDWKTTSGTPATWENWWVIDGEFETNEDATPINCEGDAIESVNQANALLVHVDLNNATLYIQNEIQFESFVIRDMNGRMIQEIDGRTNNISLQKLPAGTYMLHARDNNGLIYAVMFVK